MSTISQNIQPKVAGLPCEVQVINSQGHGVLTTYDQSAVATVDDAMSELVDFWDSCIKEYKGGGLGPKTWGRTPDQAESEAPNLVDVKAPDFDLADYVQLTVMPGPMAGG